jgi:acyl-CoA synthetase (AMP-forming)/AMP-acid ligase II
VKDINQRLFDKNHVNAAMWRFPHENLSVSVCELRNRIKAFARVLRHKKIGKGDRVGFIVDNGCDLVCLLYATWYLNAVAVPLRPRSGRYHDYRTYISKCDGICRFKLVIFDGKSADDELSCWAAESDKSIVSVREITGASDPGQFAGDSKPAAIAPLDIAVIQFSSGSTGDPKGVIVTHAMMMAQLQNIEDNHGRSRGRKVASMASWLPINHDMGLFIGVLSPVFSGCDNLLATPAYYLKNPPRWFALLASHRVDFTFSTNSVLASSLGTLRRLQQQTDTDLSNLHLYIAAEKVSPIIIRRTWSTLAQFRCPKQNIHVGYGMAENALGATYTTSGPIKMYWFVLHPEGRLSLSDASNPHAFELASIGIASDHHTVTVRDRNDNVLPELTLGEFFIESPCISPGYYNDPQATALKLGGGRLRTGDLGFQYDGEFYFYSRSDDLIISGGRNVVPDDIEITTETLDFVRSGGSVLLGIENPQLGVMHLHLLVEGDARQSEKEIQSRRLRLRQHILDAHDLLIRNISFCGKGSVEKTSSGKKRRKAIRQRLLDGELIILPQENFQTVQQASAQYEYEAAV